MSCYAKHPDIAGVECWHGPGHAGDHGKENQRWPNAEDPMQVELAALRKVADAAAEEVRRWQDEAADRLGQVAVLKEEVAKLNKIADAAARWRDAADRGDDGWHEHQATDFALKEAGR